MIYVLDTNIITAILKGNKKAKKRTQEIIVRGEEILINAISYYEIKRGLLAVQATTHLNTFNRLCDTFGLVLLDTQSIFDEAAEIYVNLKLRGALIEDADILIAAVAKTRNFILVSDDSHFQRITGLSIENWLA